MEPDEDRCRIEKAFLLGMGIIGLVEKKSCAVLEEIEQKKDLIRENGAKILQNLLGERKSFGFSLSSCDLERNARKIAEDVIAEENPVIIEEIQELKKEVRILSKKLAGLKSAGKTGIL